MNKSLYLLAAFVILFAGCKNNSYKKSKDGSEYLIIANESGTKAMPGNFMQLNILAKYKDSVLFSSIESSTPSFVPYDTAQLPPFFKNIHEGDSMIIRISTDTLIKNGRSAPFMKKGEYVYQYFKVVKIFTSKDQADAAALAFQGPAKIKARAKTMEQIKKYLSDNATQLTQDDKLLTDYIAANKLSATKAPWGTYVVTTNPGTGDALTDSSIVVVNYTGKTLDGKVFDSNTDTAFKHKEPLNVDLSNIGQVILGWTDGLKQMKKGSKGTLLIPSVLAYGKNGSGDKIKANENLIFDVEITDILTPAQMQAKQMEMQQKQQMMQQMQQQKMQQMQQQNPAK